MQCACQFFADNLEVLLCITVLSVFCIICVYGCMCMDNYWPFGVLFSVADPGFENGGPGRESKHHDSAPGLSRRGGGGGGGRGRATHSHYGVGVPSAYQTDLWG